MSLKVGFLSLAICLISSQAFKAVKSQGDASVDMSVSTMALSVEEINSSSNASSELQKENRLVLLQSLEENLDHIVEQVADTKRRLAQVQALEIELQQTLSHAVEDEARLQKKIETLQGQGGARDQRPSTLERKSTLRSTGVARDLTTPEAASSARRSQVTIPGALQPGAAIYNPGHKPGQRATPFTTQGGGGGSSASSPGEARDAIFAHHDAHLKQAKNKIEQDRLEQVQRQEQNETRRINMAFGGREGAKSTVGWMLAPNALDSDPRGAQGTSAAGGGGGGADALDALVKKGTK